ncbi:hypothetical protein BC939DRAFT_226114 [Gamsiella multidivaricata]|uniref:uncharacterized protein n=1 Tax=Gamsiella multidivaricata TaxID=101098 RepID=UPI00221F4A1D|nr:uncharacterized protein BC939DRAFT_226114 [Gamsiella multidivaricata]KAI7831317.1 hypothetical protein BC939DRAFT_226114 [Gamsiella multidivaricata]
MMGRLNALSAILEVNPITPDRLLSCLPDVNDWSQFNQLNQFCSTLFEDVSGKVFEPQAFDTLFPDYDQKQNPIALDAGFGIDGLANYNAASASLSNNSAVNNNMGFNGASQGESIYSTVIPDDPYLPTASMAPSMTYGSTGMGWDGMGVGIPTQGVVRSMPTRVGIQQPVNPFDNRNISSMINARNSRAKPDVKIELKEEIIEPRVEIKAERSYADMSTQTKAKERQAADGGMMTLQRPAEKKKQQRSPYEGMDPTLLMLSAPAVPDTPLPELERNVEDLEQAAAEDSTRGSQESEAAAASTTPSTPTSKYGGYVEKARAKQAAVAAAAAATAPVEPLDPLEAMTRQLAQTHLDESNVKIVTKPATVKPVTEGDMERQIKAAKARAMCSQDPVRKQHAEVILSLLKSIDTLMAEHRQKVALYKETQARQEAGSIRGSSPSIYPRTGVNAQKQGQIRTVSSYLPRRPPYQSSPLHQEQSGSDPAYSQLRSNLNDSPSAYASANATSSSSDTPVFYPSPNLQQTPDEEPFELSEEERRFIEEDNARIAAARQEADRQVHV